MIKKVKLKVGATHPVPTGDMVMRSARGDRAYDHTRPNKGQTSVTGTVEKMDGVGAYKLPPKPAPFILRGWNREES